ncbi:MAG: T9SS type A sorting domain-containing protein, partial [Bacteroidales bacterium]|nr:T9SS type A sorting domain-containing protein [Bacteroidales bacterium]
EWNGQLYSESGVYQQTFPAANGCDSIVTLHLDLIDAYEITFDTTVCERFVWNGHEYTQSGHYEQTFVSINDCDSVVSMNLVVWQHPDPIPEIMGLQEIFVSTDFVHYEYNYQIDSVAFATHYEWICEVSDWVVDASETHCTLIATSSGTTTLKVRAWNDYCGYTEQDIVIRAGFYDIDENIAFPIKVYPNPAHDNVFIEAEGIISVRVFDLFGQCLTEKTSEPSNRVELSLQDYAASIYLIEVQTQHGIARTKIYH